jgi:hypothetical protein
VPTLNTPAKRIGLLVAIAGGFICLLGYSHFRGTYGPLSNALYAFERGPFWALRHTGIDTNATGGLLLWIGVLMFVAGLFASYLYEPTVGAVVHWVRTGSFPQQPSPPTPVPKEPWQFPKWVQWLAAGLVVLIENGGTALVIFPLGLFYWHTGERTFLLVPAGVGFMFWLFAAFRTRDDQTLALTPLLFVKVAIAYLFFGVGYFLSSNRII